ncbi:MAG: DnaD domain protein [Bacilli bacterium]|nr:DnaD domain protein [Bacilli bacterium]
MAPNYFDSDLIDFRHLLLSSYTKMGLSENELVTIFMIDHLTKNGNAFITADLLALKMNLKTKELDSILAALLKKDLISYESTPTGLRTSLEPLRAKLYNQLQAGMEKDKVNLLSAEREGILTRLNTYFEKRLNRTLSPLEMDVIGNWLDDAYEEEEIRNALEDAIAKRRKSFKSIDKILRAGRTRNDIDKEGYSSVNDRWSKDIEHTIEIAKTKWIDDEA